jgi:hypothetical protein
MRILPSKKFNVCTDSVLPACLCISSLAQASAEAHRHFDLLRCKLAGKVSTGHVRRVEARSLHRAGAQVKPPQIGLAKVKVGEIDACDVYSAKVKAAKIAATQVACLAGFPAPIEFLGATFAQQQVERIG